LDIIQEIERKVPNATKKTVDVWKRKYANLKWIVRCANGNAACTPQHTSASTYDFSKSALSLNERFDILFKIETMRLVRGFGPIPFEQIPEDILIYIANPRDARL
jgi:hypothetical protein